MTNTREERIARLVEKAWADFVNCRDDQYFGNRSKLEKQHRVLHKFADAIAVIEPSPDVSATTDRTEIIKALHWSLGVAAGVVEMGDPGYEHACALLQRLESEA